MATSSSLRIPAPTHHPAMGARPRRLPFHAVSVRPRASSGIGAETARMLAARGAHVVMAVRNLAAAEAVRQAVLAETPDASVEVMELDLSFCPQVHRRLRRQWPPAQHPHVRQPYFSLLLVPIMRKALDNLIVEVQSGVVKTRFRFRPIAISWDHSFSFRFGFRFS